MAYIIRVNTKSLALAFTIALGGCTTISEQGRMVRDASSDMVKSCQFVGFVHGSSAWAGMMSSTALESARAEARNEAAELGATHIVWKVQDSNAFTGQNASGDAYRCNT